MYRGREILLPPSDGSGSAESAWEEIRQNGPKYHPFDAQDAREARRLALEMPITQTQAYIEIKEQIIKHSNSTGLRKPDPIHLYGIEMDSIILKKLCEKLKEEGFTVTNPEEYKGMFIITW